MLVRVKPVPGLEEGDFIHHQNQLVSEVDRHSRRIFAAPAFKFSTRTASLAPFRKERTFTTSGVIWLELKQVKVSRSLPAKWFTVDTLDQLMVANGVAASDVAVT